MIPEEISRFEERYQELEKGVMERKAPAEAEQKSEEKMTATHRSETKHEEAAAANHWHAATAAACTFVKKSEASAGVRRSSDANAAAASKDQAATAAAHTEAAAGTEDRKEEEDEELLALIRERKTIKKEDKERIREVSKKIKKCIRDTKRSERLGKSQEILKSSKGQKKCEHQISKEANSHSEDQEHQSRVHNTKKRNRVSRILRQIV